MGKGEWGKREWGKREWRACARGDHLRRRERDGDRLAFATDPDDGAANGGGEAGDGERTRSERAVAKQRAAPYKGVGKREEEGDGGRTPERVRKGKTKGSPLAVPRDIRGRVSAKKASNVHGIGRGRRKRKGG